MAWSLFDLAQDLADPFEARKSTCDADLDCDGLDTGNGPISESELVKRFVTITGSTREEAIHFVTNRVSAVGDLFGPLLGFYFVQCQCKDQPRAQSMALLGLIQHNWIEHAILPDMMSEDFAEAVAKCTSLESVSFRWEVSQEAAIVLLESVGRNTGVASLAPPGIALRSTSVFEALLQCLEHSPSITSLYFSPAPAKTGLGERANRITDIILRRGLPFDVVNFAGQALGVAQMDGIAALLRRNLLSKVSLGMNHLSHEDAMASIAAVLPDTTSLKGLYLSSSDLGDIGVCRLANGLCGNASLCELFLSYNRISNVGARFLAESLLTSSIIILHLDGNLIADDGAACLGNLLEVLCIEDLSLDNNIITGQGITVIASSLYHNAHLTKISLSGNPLEDHGAELIAAALRTNACIRELSLSSALITAEGAQWIFDALVANTGLCKLIMSKNPFGPRGAQFVSRALKENNALEILHLNECKLGDEGASLIASTLCQSSLRALELRDNDIHDHGGFVSLMKAIRGPRNPRPQKKTQSRRSVWNSLRRETSDTLVLTTIT